MRQEGVHFLFLDPSLEDLARRRQLTLILFRLRLVVLVSDRSACRGWLVRYSHVLLVLARLICFAPGRESCCLAGSFLPAAPRSPERARKLQPLTCVTRSHFLLRHTQYHSNHYYLGLFRANCCTHPFSLVGGVFRARQQLRCGSW